MFTQAMIVKRIRELPSGTIFTTRQMLVYGSTRAAVDQCLYRLVKGGAIIRKARGVFVRNDIINREPTVEEMAMVKAESFCRRLATHGRDTGEKLDVFEPIELRPKYLVNARSTSFNFSGVRIMFKGTSPRKMNHGDTKAGEVIKSLWHLGEDVLLKTPDVVKKALAHMQKNDWLELLNLWRCMPAWMADAIRAVQDTKLHALIVKNWESVADAQLTIYASR